MPEKHCQGRGGIPAGQCAIFPQVYSGPSPRRLVAHTASATEASTSKPPMADFLAGESSSSLCLCEERSDEAISWANEIATLRSQ
jgi:hypothetical protein